MDDEIKNIKIELVKTKINKKKLDILKKMKENTFMKKPFVISRNDSKIFNELMSKYKNNIALKKNDYDVVNSIRKYIDHTNIMFNNNKMNDEGLNIYFIYMWDIHRGNTFSWNLSAYLIKYNDETLCIYNYTCDNENNFVDIYFRKKDIFNPDEKKIIINDNNMGYITYPIDIWSINF